MIPRLRIDEGTDGGVLDLLRALERTGFAGEVRTDYAARLVSATDNSVYQLLPAAVVYPRTTADVAALLALGHSPPFRHIPMSPRGGGTGTNGQSLTGGVVIDVSKHMDRIGAVDLEGERVVVQPGVVLDQLNRALEPVGRFFAPSLSPSNRATLGGMIGTDACGKGSRIYGRTSDHVLSLQIVLTDGSVWRAEPMDEDTLTAACAREDLAGRALRTVRDVVRDRRALIDATFPQLQRFMTGYNLAMVDGPRGFDPCRLIAGAEGTLGVVTEATLRLTPVPRHKRLVVLRYGSFEDALADAEALLAHDPAAIETIDETVLTLARRDIIYHTVGPLLDVPGAPPARTINLVELIGEDPARLDARMAALVEASSRGGATGHHVARNAGETGALWDLRKKGVGLLGNAPGDRRPLPFVEDTVVPPARLAEYVREFRAILDEHGLSYGMFGHVDVGCLHVRPALDMTMPSDEKLLRRISDQVADLTQRFGGMMWGEHGKGYRSEYNPRFFGEELYRELCRIKGAFDPDNRLNPGKIATPLGSGALVSVDDAKRGALDRQILPALRERHAVAVRCNGNAACYDWDVETVMCPSWKGTRDRVHSPKGRAAVMREWLRRLTLAEWTPAALPSPMGWIDRIINTVERARGEADFSHEVHAAMNGCLSCKACATQCPIKVDVPEMKADFLAQYHGRYLRPAKDWLVAALEPSLPLAALAPRLFNGVMGSSPARELLRALGVVDSPPIAEVSLQRGLRERGLDRWDPGSLARLPADERARTVILVQDSFTRFYEPHVALAVIDLLRALGFEVAVLPWFQSGKGLHVKGFLSRFARAARRAADRLTEAAATGLPLVGIEPAVVLALGHEVPHALRMAEPPWRVHLLQEWLVGALRERPAVAPTGGRWTLLGHCTEKALAPPSQQQWVQVFAALGQELRLERAGCCGMSGMYGHEAEHRDTSRGIYAMGWEAHVPADPAARGRLLVTGTSCRSQVHRFSSFAPLHPAEALLRAVRGA